MVLQDFPGAFSFISVFVSSAICKVGQLRETLQTPSTDKDGLTEKVQVKKRKRKSGPCIKNYTLQNLIYLL